MQKIVLIENPLESQDFEIFEVEDVRPFLMERFKEWPRTARIYHEKVSNENDVTPTDEASVEKLATFEGALYVIIYPAGPVAIAIAVVVALVVIVAVAAVALTSAVSAPQIPNVAVRQQGENRQSSSPNNQLSQRQNTSRLGGRIPDIFGQVRSTPDLLSVPYRVYENNQEVEIAYMCIGKGSYDVEDIMDGDQLVSEISGTSVAIYAPGTSPNSGSPQLQVGSAISDDLLQAKELTSVNGQVLRAPNSDSVSGSSNIRFFSPNGIEVNSGAGIDFTDFFAPADSLTVSSATYTGAVVPFGITQSCRFTLAGEIVFQTGNPSHDFQAGDSIDLSSAARTDGSHPIDLAGSYTILSVSSTKITLDSPSGVNTDWLILSMWSGNQTGFANSDIDTTAGSRSLDLSGTYTILSVSSTQVILSNPEISNADWYALDELASQQTGYISPLLVTASNKWIGPFTIDVTDLDQVFSNFIALQGLYKDNGTQQIRFDVTVELELTPVDAGGTPTGAAETFQGTIQGSSKVKDTRAITIKASPTFTGRCKVRARRVTNSDLGFEGTVVDEIKWASVYAISPVTQTDFGDVTTVHNKTYATSGALAVKERKLNMLATRKIPTRISGTTFDPTLTATKSADEIFTFICLDPYIGNRNISELDLDSIYDAVAEIKDYFGSDVAAEFSYTFDNNNLSFEETATTIANAIFCTPYRQGNIIKFSFEKATENSSLIFNHRNKLPGSEKRTISFGTQDDNDGVEIEYVDPSDDSVTTYYIPTDRSAINAKKVETVGIRSIEQAFWLGWRVFNKIQYQNTVSEFQATQEAALAVITDRVLIADNTRPDTQDGEIIAQDGLTLTTSQPVIFVDGKTYTIFLQHYDGTVESIAITAGATEREVVLGTAPALTIVTEQEKYARCTYIVINDDSTRIQAFMLAEKEPQDNFTYNVKFINYHPLFYQQDQLQLWLFFANSTYDDESPLGRNGTAHGGANIATDGTRGQVYVGTAIGDYVSFATFDPPVSYTKMAWIYKTSLVTDGNIISSAASSDEAFFINSSGNLASGHSGTWNSVEAAWPGATSWHHAAVSYDVDTTTMKLYIDGELADENNSVAQRTINDIICFGINSTSGLIGKADDIRLYKAALTDNEIREIYRATVL